MYSLVRNQRMANQQSLKHQKNSEFLQKLAEILDDELNWKIIRYDKKKHKLIITNKGKLESLLPLYFKHSRYQSFSRQLNWFGFEKLRGGPYHVYENEGLKNGKQLHELVSKRKQIYQKSTNKEKNKKKEEQFLGNPLDHQNQNNSDLLQNCLNTPVNHFYFHYLPEAPLIDYNMLVPALLYPVVWQ